MKTVWTSGLDAKEAEEIKSAFKANARLRERLKDICEKEKDSAYCLSKSDYDCPNWTLLQADSVGYRRALDKIISLISEK